MKKTLLIAVVTAVLIGGIAARAGVTTVNEEQRGYISVTANANKEISPDIAEISIEVQTFDSKSIQKATADNKLISDKVYTAVKSMISPGDFIKTANFSASPQYNYSANKKVFDKYKVSNCIIVRTKNLKDIGAIIDSALSLGATNVNNLTFTLSNYDSQCNELLALAAKKAKSQADTVAQAASTTIAGIKSISTSCSTSNISPRVHYNLLSARGSGTSDAAIEEATPIESGTVKIHANINAQFYVK